MVVVCPLSGGGPGQNSVSAARAALRAEGVCCSRSDGVLCGCSHSALPRRGRRARPAPALALARAPAPIPLPFAPRPRLPALPVLLLAFVGVQQCARFIDADVHLSQVRGMNLHPYAGDLPMHSALLPPCN